MITLTILDQRYAGKVSIKITDLGHTFIALVVAFLLVSRVNIALNRYNQARVALGTMYASSRELVQYAVLFSSLDHTDRAREWRLELSYRLLILLRTSMAVTDFATTHQAAWDVPELHGTLKDDICDSTCMSAGRRWAHAQRNVWEESLRVPIRVAYLLRKSIHSQTTRLDHPMHVTQENILLAKVDAFLTGYYAMRQFLTTPVPFPLIQMARTFLFLYVFTVPLVFVADKSSLLAHCFAIFVLTYGYVGLELVAIELDDPFGDDPNDFNNQYVYYNCILLHSKVCNRSSFSLTNSIIIYYCGFFVDQNFLVVDFCFVWECWRYHHRRLRI